MATGQTEDALIRGTRSGDAEAFGELSRRFQGRIYTLCLRMTGDPAIAEAIAQSVLLGAYNDAEFLEEPLQSWLLQRALNACTAPPQVTADPLDEEPDTETEEEVAGHQLQALFNGLSTTFRAAVILRDVLELDYDQVADILNLPLGTARSRVHRARLDLAAEVSQMALLRKPKAKAKAKAKAKPKAKKK